MKRLSEWELIANRARRPALFGWTVLLTGLVLSFAAYRYVSSQLENDARFRFEFQSREIHRAIEGRLGSYADLLWGLKALHQASGGISRREFHEYVQSLQLRSRYPAISVINFAEQVTPSSKGAFERRVRLDSSVHAQGYPRFHVTPVGERHEYQVFTYMEPFEPYRQMLGVDLLELPNSRIEEVKASGNVISSGAVVAHQPGLPLALRLALYEGGTTPASIEARRQAFIGSLGMGFSLVQLIREAVPPDMLSTIRIQIRNVGRTGTHFSEDASHEGLLLMDTARVFSGWTGDAPQHLRKRFLDTRTRLDFGGALLELSFQAPADLFQSALGSRLPMLVLLAGFTASLLLSGIVAGLLRSKRLLRRAVAVRSRELRAANRTLEQEIARRNRLEREVMHTLVEERRRFGQELHDNLGQQLTAAAFLIESLRSDLQERIDEAADQAGMIDRYMSTVMAQTRALARGLNPAAAEAGGLAMALEHLASDAHATLGIGCRFEREDEADAVVADYALEHNLFRIAQQALADAATRRSASMARIRIRHGAGELRLIVADNGEKINPGPGANVAVRVIAYRCAVLGLELDIRQDATGWNIMDVRIRLGRAQGRP